MAEGQNKLITVNKIVMALIVFLGIGFLTNSFLNYSQNATTQTTLEERAVVGDEILKLNKNQSEQIKTLVEKVTNVETKLENLEKAGKSIK